MAARVMAALATVTAVDQGNDYANKQNRFFNLFSFRGLGVAELDPVRGGPAPIWRGVLLWTNQERHH